MGHSQWLQECTPPDGSLEMQNHNKAENDSSAKRGSLTETHEKEWKEMRRCSEKESSGRKCPRTWLTRADRKRYLCMDTWKRPNHRARDWSRRTSLKETTHALLSKLISDFKEDKKQPEKSCQGKPLKPGTPESAANAWNTTPRMTAMSLRKHTTMHHERPTQTMSNGK